MSSKLTLEARILKLEEGQSVPGTMLTRSFKPFPEEGIQWILGIGPLGMPKEFFSGDTLEEAVAKAEKSKAKKKRARKGTK